MAALSGIRSRCSLTRDMARRLDLLVWSWRPRQNDWLQVVSGCMLKFSLDWIPAKAKKLMKLFSPLGSKRSNYWLSLSLALLVFRVKGDSKLKYCLL